MSTYPPIHCGVGEYTRFLARTMIDREPSINLIVLAESGVSHEYNDNGIRVIPTFKKRDLESISEALKTLERLGGSDILHVQHEYGIFGGDDRLLSLLEEARSRGVFKRLVITLHTVYHPAINRDYALFQERILDVADAVVVHSPIQEFELIAWYGAYPSHLHRIPHGTMLNPYYSEPRRSLSIELGINPDRIMSKTLLVVPGFLRRDKGLDTLLEALDSVEGGVLVIVAGEVIEESLAVMAREAEREGKLVFIPRYLSSKEILMLAAMGDVIVLPYRDPPGKYSVSGILHLSMGSMKPIIGTNVPRLTELYTLTPRLVVRSGDPIELSTIINKFTNREYLDIMIPYAGSLYSYAVRTSWSRTAFRHLKLYKNLLTG